METPSIKIEVNATASSQPPLLADLSTVAITLIWETEEFIIDEKDGSLTSLGSYPNSSLPDQEICLNPSNFETEYVYKLLHHRLHDQALCQLISSHILVEAQGRSQVVDMKVDVKLTQKVFFVMPCTSAPSKSESETEESCAICLEKLSESGTETKSILQLPNCVHLFHELCFQEWLDRDNNSCPLYRESVDRNKIEELGFQV